MTKKETEYTVRVPRRKALQVLSYGAIATVAGGIGAAVGCWSTRKEEQKETESFLDNLKESESGLEAAQKGATPTPTLETPTATAEPTPYPTATPNSEEAAARFVQEQLVISEKLERGEPIELFRAEEALDYPLLQKPDPKREPVFPDVEKGERLPLAAYETPFESGDYFHTGKGDIDVPQYYYRVITAGKIKIDDLEIDCSSTGKKGCAVIIINHFGDSVMFREAEVDNGFTVAGRVFDMGTPEKVTEAGQALLDHYIGRMTKSEDGANCGKISACQSVEWHCVVVGNGKPQVHWAGIYTRPETE